MSTELTRDFLEATKPRVERVELPKLDAHTFVRELVGPELLVLADDRVFDMNGDLEILRTRDFDSLQAIVSAALHLNGLSATEVESLEEKSESVPS
jgi:hypothetical protein